jgi:glutathione S-transferase
MPSEPVSQGGTAGICRYGHPASPAHRTMWMLKELGLKFEDLPVSFTDGSTRQPEFMHINPNGRIPVLQTPKITLFKSMAINLSLARRYPGPLSPQTLEEDAFATQWNFWVVTDIEKPLILTSRLS